MRPAVCFVTAVLVIFRVLANPIYPPYANGTALLPSGIGSSGTSSLQPSTGAPASTGMPTVHSFSQASVSDEDDPYNKSAIPQFKARGHWPATPCNILDHRDDMPNDNFGWHWSESGAPDAWPQLLEAWNTRPESYHDQKFDHFAWSMFGIRSEGPGCDSITSESCDGSMLHTCEEGDSPRVPPAASVIMTSFAAIHQIFSTQSAALDRVKGEIEGALQPIADKFSPPEDKTLEHFALALDIISAVMPVFSASIITSAFSKILKYAPNERAIETFQEVASVGIDTTSSVLEFVTPTDDPDKMQSNLAGLLSYYYGELATAQAKFLVQLMAANETQNQDLLSGIFSTGLLLNTWTNDAQFSEDLIKQNKKMLYGHLIQSTWALSEEKLRPFILRVDKSEQEICGELSDNNPLKDLISPDAASKCLYCDPKGHSWYLLRGYKRKCYSPGGHESCESDRYVFEALPGGDSETLSGEDDAWGGLTIKDIITSSWAGFELNGKRNGYTLSSDSSLEAQDDMSASGAGGLPMHGGARTPGFFNFTICLQYEEAQRGIEDGVDAVCGEFPNKGDSGTEVNSEGSFTPGWCSVQVTQFLRNAGDKVNPLADYQLEVKVRDNIGIEIGSATKQSAKFPLVVDNSVLPWDVIVSTGANDEDPLGFWFAEQFWTSNDNIGDHQCNFGRYNGGRRTGECKFSCGPPLDPPLPSGSIDHPFPAAPSVAKPGENVFHNTYTVDAPPPTATPEPGPQPGDPQPEDPWANLHGNCGVHIVQYQRWARDLNPLDVFQLEVTIKDINNNGQVTSGKVPAPQGQPVVVDFQGHPFWVITPGADDEPLEIRYNYDDFFSDTPLGDGTENTRCGVGPYDHDERHLDCGFRC
ncbi:hypothetical protein K402DRAFT_420275 [Aulographum hederae CBS 113979]|uniref:Uncharacterized protein n=1 Tax=Aulographum hederae CBS 113979 TaxID=1176131 RepID=A0A6G1H325_9PEZI|nr:hypothetical protein K402DRAFT_420275 [Aulographum hederae CBS 113979]